MIRPIVKDVFFLGQKSEPATEEDRKILRDLQDTFSAHRSHCIGMAANMIGYRKNIIIVAMGPLDVILCNPVILKKDGVYETEESCLSLNGSRRTRRWQNIEVEYQDASFHQQRARFSGLTAQIIQHEIDHLKGIVI